ncbi:MAG: tRNA (adenosine(37)-N6)-dimethylallyltransferase MiaA [Verrucomicrobia bacterium]|nr:tRNA (adenosine(37)-N6)-dimethylallyltransferase MiaA [Verrucomicrobiota bacterium]
MNGSAFRQPALVIGGPTASGKSAFAIQLASKIGGEIVNADAFQLYRGLPLLTAQPSPEERAQATHHLFGVLALKETVDAARYAALAHEQIAAIWKRGKLPLLVGGTGLYLRTVLYGFTPGLPAPNTTLRAALEARPLQELCSELLEKDPQARHCLDLRNPRRVIRALEVCLLTGRPFTSFREKREAPAVAAGIWLALPRDELHSRIEARTRGLFEAGVEAEVAAALPELGLTAAQAIGIKQVESVLHGQCTREAAAAAITTLTRQYARRQETWFRKEPALTPCPPQNALQTALRLLSEKKQKT